MQRSCGRKAKPVKLEHPDQAESICRAVRKSEATPWQGADIFLQVVGWPAQALCVSANQSLCHSHVDLCVLGRSAPVLLTKVETERVGRGCCFCCSQHDWKPCCCSVCRGSISSSGGLASLCTARHALYSLALQAASDGKGTFPVWWVPASLGCLFRESLERSHGTASLG